MELLLDTHVFLWFISGDKRLSGAMRDSIRDSNNEVYLSVVSLVTVDDAICAYPVPVLSRA
jgi:PIN domain nuclease of toxin-antitoxin system